mmetsp:Transcript_21154/g.63653  ORF Transcript_21154/g.63653 Transcript_21154/m.63653 type:complete len:225 (+) Transcript_21154:2684-3358(+)
MATRCLQAPKLRAGVHPRAALRPPWTTGCPSAPISHGRAAALFENTSRVMKARMGLKSMPPRGGMMPRNTFRYGSVMEDSGPTSCAGGLGNHVNTSLTISAVLYRLRKLLRPLVKTCSTTPSPGSSAPKRPLLTTTRRTRRGCGCGCSRGASCCPACCVDRIVRLARGRGPSPNMPTENAGMVLVGGAKLSIIRLAWSRLLFSAWRPGMSCPSLLPMLLRTSGF